MKKKIFRYLSFVAAAAIILGSVPIHTIAAEDLTSDEIINYYYRYE